MTQKKDDSWPKTMPVEVRWLDSMGTSGWGPENSGRAKMECVTIGHLVERTPKSVILALNTSHYSRGEYLEIPAAVVKRVRKLK